MVEYKHSLHFIDILLKNGFKDITKNRFPNDWEQLRYANNQGDSYSPSSYKRKLKKGRLVIKLYDDIDISVCGTTKMKTVNHLTELQLKSIVFYTKLSSVDKMFFNKKKVNPLDIDLLLKEETNHFQYMRKNQIEKIKKYINQLNQAKIIL